MHSTDQGSCTLINFLVIATSGPSSTYPQRAYRNPTDALVKFLDYKHDKNWAIWEFRAEGTGYPDSEVYNRINHYPWPDHHPPPFALIPNIMASMRDWLKNPNSTEHRVIVVHCKAGKGRSGTIACSYLISEEGWTVQDALTQFTARRMRNGFGNGVSIPSQLRWVGYVDWWSKNGKIYVERPIEILEVHVWGLRDGVKVAIEGYVEEGKIIKTFHTFGKHERTSMDSPPSNKLNPMNHLDQVDEKGLPLHETQARASQPPNIVETAAVSEPGISTVIFRPAHQIILPSSDVNIDFERRNKATYGFTMVTSVAHAWFNAFFESQRSSTNPHDSTKPAIVPMETPTSGSSRDNGVFEITWEAMDGIKGSARKGTRALDRLAVVWRAVADPKENLTKIITEPAMGEQITDSKPADWTKAHQDSPSHLGKDLGLRTESPSSANVSRASSINVPYPNTDNISSEAGVQSHIPNGKDQMPHSEQCEKPAISISAPGTLDGASTSKHDGGPAPDLGMEKVNSPSHSPDMARNIGGGGVAGIVDRMKAVSTGDLKTAEEHVPGQFLKDGEPLSS